MPRVQIILTHFILETDGLSHATIQVTHNATGFPVTIGQITSSTQKRGAYHTHSILQPVIKHGHIEFYVKSNRQPDGILTVVNITGRKVWLSPLGPRKIRWKNPEISNGHYFALVPHGKGQKVTRFQYIK